MTDSHRASGSTKLSTRLLLRFCRKPGSADFPMAMLHYDQASALDPLSAVFPDVRREIIGKRVIDFGCGLGYQAVAYALAGAESVIGVEIDEDLARQSLDRVKQHGLASKVTIERTLTDEIKGDILVSQNSFEHFLEPARTLAQMKRALTPGGRIYITFGPTWYSPTGAHMGFFCRLPWVQLLLPERAVLEARSRYRFDGAKTYREAGLGQMSIAKFERVIKDCGLKFTWRRYDCIKGINALRYIPLVRELGINRVSCILSP